VEVVVDLSVEPAEVRLVDADVFDALKVTARGSGDASEGGDGGSDGLARALAPIGTLDPGGENAFLAVEALAGLAGSRAADPEWRAGLDRMVSFAAEHGWVDAESRVQAHVEWVDR
jgi:hypothetical protein